MPTSTPEFRQKTCTYCASTAAPLATKCSNCGGNLPVALPRPVARMVEAQSNWSLLKTGTVTSFVSIALGISWEFLNFGIIALLLVLWLVVIMPGMLGISAIVNTHGNAARFILNVFAAIGLYGAGIVLVIIAIMAI